MLIVAFSSLRKQNLIFRVTFEVTVLFQISDKGKESQTCNF